MNKKQKTWHLSNFLRIFSPFQNASKSVDYLLRLQRRLLVFFVFTSRRATTKAKVASVWLKKKYIIASNRADTKTWHISMCVSIFYFGLLDYKFN